MDFWLQTLLAVGVGVVGGLIGAVMLEGLKSIFGVKDD